MSADPVIKDLDAEMRRQTKAEAAEIDRDAYVEQERRRLLARPEGMCELLAELDCPYELNEVLAALCAGVERGVPFVVEDAARKIHDMLNLHAMLLAANKHDNPPPIRVPEFLKSPRSA